MLDQDLILNLARKNQIAPEHIAREIYEILILRHLSQSPLLDSLIFKGGTALRLAYHSPRFSEDLDFSLIREISRTYALASK